VRARGDASHDYELTGGQGQALERRERGARVSALKPRDRRLRDTATLGKLALREAGQPAQGSNDSTRFNILQYINYD
jgi:hypothetical protein